MEEEEEFYRGGHGGKNTELHGGIEKGDDSHRTEKKLANTPLPAV